MARSSLYCAETDTTIHVNDVVTISTYPGIKFITKRGWHTIGTAKINGWYFISVADKSILSIDQVDITTISKDTSQGLSKNSDDDSNYSLADKPAPPPIDSPSQAEFIPDDLADLSISDTNTPIKYDYLLIPNTDIRLYAGDIVKISTYPRRRWIVQHGWFTYDSIQQYEWYLLCINNNEILPASVIDLTLCSLVSVKTQGSDEYNGRVVNYVRPFTPTDAEVLKRAFVTVQTIEQRDNLDPKYLVEGKLVRVNDVGGVSNYYSYDSALNKWDRVDWGGSSGGIPEIIGTTAKPITLSQLEEGLYRVLGTYKISSTYETITFATIDHIVFVSRYSDKTNIKVITDALITDYQVDDEDEVVFINEYATYKYLSDNYASLNYVDNKVAAIEAQISEITIEFKDKVLDVMNESLDNISDDYINDLF